MRPLAPILAALLLALPVSLVAQRPTVELAPGARVRLDAHAARGTYTLVRATADTIVVVRDAAAPPLAVAFADARRVDVSLGRRSAASGFGRGFAVGALAGGLTGAVLGLADGDDESGFFMLSAGDKAMLGGVLLGAAGGLVGGVIGATSPGERWARVPGTTRVGVAPGPGGRVTLALSRAF